MQFTGKKLRPACHPLDRPPELMSRQNNQAMLHTRTTAQAERAADILRHYVKVSGLHAGHCRQ